MPAPLLLLVTVSVLGCTVVGLVAGLAYERHRRRPSLEPWLAEAPRRPAVRVPRIDLDEVPAVRVPRPRPARASRPTVGQAAR